MTKERKKQFKNVNLKTFWKRLWYLLKPSHRGIKILLGFVLLFQMVKLLGPYILKLIIDLIVNFNEENIPKILALVAAMFIVNQLVAIIDYFADRQIMTIISNVEKYLAVNAQKKLLFLPLSFHEKENTGNKITKVQRGVDKVLDLLFAVFWEIGPTIVQIIFTAIVLFIVDWRFGAIFLFFIPIFLAMTIKLNRKVFPSRIKRHDDYEIASGKMAQGVININTVKSFVQEEREEREYKSIRDEIKKLVTFEFTNVFRYNLGRNFIIDAGRVSIVLFGVYLVWTGGITVGSLVFIVTITEKALLSLFRISRLYDRIMESSEAIERLYILDKEKSNIDLNLKGIKPRKIIGHIDFNNVNFVYDNSKEKALENVSLKISAGCTTALVGPSGGGKTTVARMIYRHYDPQSGTVKLDDRNLRDYNLYEFRKFISIVPQEVEVFNSTIRDNIAYAKPDAGAEEVKAAARIANADEFINKLSDKYETEVGERGIKLSGGQRQRVGIARAILANPRILIFDEATSSLDSYSEKLIQEAIQKISKGRTVIIIAHRLSTIQRADKIIVLEGGKVVEVGNHLELASKKGGMYSRLLNLQKMGDVV